MHIFLLTTGEILTGNVISDFVKGKKKFEYPSRIQAVLCCTVSLTTLR